MELGRAAKFGLFGSIGLTLIWSVLFLVFREGQTGVEGGTTGGDLTVLVIVLGGTVASLVMLFLLFGEYLDQKLAARGLTGAELE